MNQPIYKISILGPQGSGKGTQAELLSANLHIPTFSMGQLLRDESEKDTPEAHTLRAILNSGALVPSELSNGVFAERMASSDAARGYIMDGYPRNMEQHDFIRTVDSFTHVIELTLLREKAMERISGRRMCVKCHAMYHIKFKSPLHDNICDVCQSPLAVRDDDKPEAIDRRLAIFKEETIPVIEQYRVEKLVHMVSGAQTIEEVHQDIMKIFEKK